ncbi:hypothetical protein TVD_12410 [Thioalkalivibrio versutus]|uniref:Intracellular sulfur oxidation DsrE/DsrF family protein n=1 Tax=Thioalkalivibrio versutus TaxID=106634 RepID=A0A0G3G9C3_9GAMM|nr:hypothetical protein [Thioalkalivibrio versutus]AKJ96107.1 hypothetical protein TVD_12410 [Thioalkalivibrio versutus]
MSNERLSAKNRPSEEILNAFVDGEFSPEDRLFTLKTIASSEHLSREVCDMHQLKELVNMAYEDVPAGRAAGTTGGRCRLSRGGGSAWFPSVAAGVLALVVGSLGGYEITRDAGFFGGDHAAAPGQESGALAQVAASDNAPGGAAAPQQVFSATETDQILLHINEADTRAVAELLDDIESMYREAATVGRDLNVQVVVHNNAMGMLRTDSAPYPERVASMAEAYPTLRFTACAQTLNRLAREEGQKVDILPQAELIDSGVAEAARRQAEGWIYIKV